jgi:hypothetical protein
LESILSKLDIFKKDLKKAKKEDMDNILLNLDKIVEIIQETTFDFIEIEKTIYKIGELMLVCGIKNYDERLFDKCMNVTEILKDKALKLAKHP